MQTDRTLLNRLWWAAWHVAQGCYLVREDGGWWWTKAVPGFTAPWDLFLCQQKMKGCWDEDEFDEDELDEDGWYCPDLELAEFDPHQLGYGEELCESL